LVDNSFIHRLDNHHLTPFEASLALNFPSDIYAANSNDYQHNPSFPSTQDATRVATQSPNINNPHLSQQVTGDPPSQQGKTKRQVNKQNETNRIGPDVTKAREYIERTIFTGGTAS